jgi:hypothetical protein
MLTEPLPSKWTSDSGFQAVFTEALSSIWIIPSEYVDNLILNLWDLTLINPPKLNEVQLTFHLKLL